MHALKNLSSPPSSRPRIKKGKERKDQGKRRRGDGPMTLFVQLARKERGKWKRSGLVPAPPLGLRQGRGTRE